jgi:two-component system invasion response regulator UvrY
LLGVEYQVLDPVSTLLALDEVLLHSDESIDLLLLDLVFRDESVLPRLPRYLRRRPELKVVVVSAYFGRGTGDAIFGAGAHGAFSKLDDPSELPHIIRTVIEGGNAASSSFLRPTTEGKAGDHPLGEQALRVVELLASGLPYKQVADLLCVTEKTVEYHVAQVRRRLGLTDTHHQDWQDV